MGFTSILKILGSLILHYWDKLSDEDKAKIKQECRKIIEAMIRSFYKKYREKQGGNREKQND